MSKFVGLKLNSYLNEWLIQKAGWRAGSVRDSQGFRFLFSPRKVYSPMIMDFCHFETAPEMDGRVKS